MFGKSFLPAVALMAAAIVAPSASAQAKVGVINFQQAMSETAEIKKAQADLEKKFKPRQDALEKVQRELADIQTQLNSSQGKLSAQGEADLNAQGARKQRDSQRLGEDLSADIEAERTSTLQKFNTRMIEVVKKLSEEKGLDLVVDTGSAVYYKSAIDITKDAVAAYDKTYPAK